MRREGREERPPPAHDAPERAVEAMAADAEIGAQMLQRAAAQEPLRRPHRDRYDGRLAKGVVRLEPQAEAEPPGIGEQAGAERRPAAVVGFPGRPDAGAHLPPADAPAGAAEGGGEGGGPLGRAAGGAESRG